MEKYFDFFMFCILDFGWSDKFIDFTKMCERLGCKGLILKLCPKNI